MRISIVRYLTSSIMNDGQTKGLGFIGFGKIAQAMSLGIINKNLLDSNQIFASDKFIDVLHNLKSMPNSPFKNHDINLCKTNEELVRSVDKIVISVKPNDIKTLLKDISKYIDADRQLILSVAAGVKLEDLSKNLPANSRVMRIMTNMPALIQEGCSVYATGANCTQEDVQFVRSFLQSIGTCEGELSEDLFDVFTALSGSGPAFMCVILDALADGALAEGLNKEMAIKLAARTMHGTSSMILRNYNHQRHLYQLRDDVCSPAGTTINGLIELDKTQFRYALIKCIEAATRRAKELSQLNDV